MKERLYEFRLSDHPDVGDITVPLLLSPIDVLRIEAESFDNGFRRVDIMLAEEVCFEN